MKSKFISLILSVAVIVGLMMVPAVPSVGMAAVTLDCGIEIQPAAQNVGFYENFSVNITVTNPTGRDLNTVMCHVNFTPALVEVVSITHAGSPFSVAKTESWDNTTGWLDSDYETPSGTVTNATPIYYCTVNMKSKGISGVADLEFSAVDQWGYGETDVINAGIGYLNWTMVFDGNVTVGSPELTVNVTGEGDVRVDGSIPPGYPNTTEWGWYDDVDVVAEPALGWTFVNWSGDLTGSDPIEAINMDVLTKSVTAHFEPLPCLLNVTPDSISCAVRKGPNSGTANVPVVIKNDGGGTLRWQVGYPPVWSVGDTWTYWNTYNESYPGVTYPNPLWVNYTCPENNTQLALTVVAEDNCTYTAVADWAVDPQRVAVTPMGNLTACMQDAVVVVDKCNLDYISQVANLTLWLGPGSPMPGQAFVTWVYDGCHGWPYYNGKTWTYNMTVVDALHSVTYPCAAAVTAGPVASPIGGPETDCYEITHTMLGTPFMMQYWSDTARNFVYQWDGGTFYAPPLDQRFLLGKSILGLPGPACNNNTVCNTSFDPMSGWLAAGETASVTVTCDVTGLDEGTFNGSFAISSCCCTGIQDECVNVTCTVLPPTTIDVIRHMPLDFEDYDAEYPGDWFWVNITFQAPDDNFTVGITDFAPPGWDVETRNDWCNPAADNNMSPYNKAEYLWYGPYDTGDNFTAKYKVTIPATASPGVNAWPACEETCPACGESSPINDYCAWAEYWFGPLGPFESSICGNYTKMVTVPGPVWGETRDVNANPLDTVLVQLWEKVADWEDSDVSTMTTYENWADDTGEYWQEASKYCYFTLETNDGSGYWNFADNPPIGNAYLDYINFTTPEQLALGWNMDFEGDYGLVPKACTMGYAMESINHWQFTPIDGAEVEHPEWQLSDWKALESVHAWQVPSGCHT